MDAHAHTAAVIVDAPAHTAFEFMASAEQQTHWALGSWNRRHVRDDIWVGNSMFDGKELYVRVTGHPELLLVDYFGGPSADALDWMVTARIVPGPNAGVGAEQSLIMLTQWRRPEISAEEWTFEFHLWQTEVQLIKGALARAAQADR